MFNESNSYQRVHHLKKPSVIVGSKKQNKQKTFFFQKIIIKTNNFHSLALNTSCTLGFARQHHPSAVDVGMQVCV